MSNNKDFKVKNSIQPTVYHEAVGTVVSGAEGYYFSGGSYDSVSFSVSGQDADPYGLFFRSDGAKMYVAGDAGNDINEYNLSTPWTVSSASYSQNFSVASQESAPNGVFFKTDGTKMFVVGTATDTVYEYALSSAWDISSASYGSVSFSVGSQDTVPTDLAFKTDGTKMFIVGSTGDNVYEYALSSAWVVSSASYTRSFSLASQETGPTGLFFSSDGLNMVVVGAAGVNKYVLSSAWDISTASYSQAFSVSSQEGDPQALFFKSDGTKMYVLGSSNDTIYQYSTALSTAQLDLSTGSVFGYTPTSDVQVTLTNPAASGTSSGATLLLGSEDSTGVGSTFSTTLYTGTGATNSIDNGLDLAGDGGLVWIKKRNSATNSDHMLFDTERGANNRLRSNTADQAYAVTQQLNSFNSNGFTLGTDSPAAPNVSGDTYVSWSFKKQTKFFDIVTWTGNGTHPRTISHNLNSSIGFMATKETNASGNWTSFHRGLTNGFGTGRLYLNATNSIQNESLEFLTSTNSSFTFTSDTGLNSNGVNYVAYLFAHDTDASSLIKCGGYTGTGATGNNVTLGWEPQWLMIKNTTSGTRPWVMIDTKRGTTSSGSDQYLKANASDAEDTDSYLGMTSTGFQLQDTGGNVNAGGENFIYMAIRNPNIPTITYDPNLQWSGGTAPTLPATGETDVITFNTTDGGTTYKSALAIDGAK